MNPVRKLIFTLMLLGALFFFGGYFVSAANIVNVDFPCPTNPGLGSCPPTTDIPSYLNNLYRFAVGIAGLLALGFIVAGGVYYTVSAGSSDKQREAKSMISSALLGIALLFGSYLILNTVNPQITRLGLGFTNPEGEPLQKLQTTSTIAGSGSQQVKNECGDSFDKILSHPPNTINCANRRMVISTPISITSDSYYDTSKTIRVRSTIWQYPYFISGQAAPSSARCLIYAFRESPSSTPEFLTVQQNLELCAPKPQKTELGDQDVAGTNLGCDSPISCATKFNVPSPPARNAPDLVTLMDSIANKIPGIKNGTIPKYTFDQKYDECNYTRGNLIACSHTKNSCHYGGKTGTNGAEAVDYSISNNLSITDPLIGKKIRQAALDSGAKSARCETSAPVRESVGCIAGTFSHIHVNAMGCDVN